EAAGRRRCQESRLDLPAEQRGVDARVGRDGGEVDLPPDGIRLGREERRHLAEEPKPTLVLVEARPLADLADEEVQQALRLGDERLQLRRIGAGKVVGVRALRQHRYEQRPEAARADLAGAGAPAVPLQERQEIAAALLRRPLARGVAVE